MTKVVVTSCPTHNEKSLNTEPLVGWLCRDSCVFARTPAEPVLSGGDVQEIVGKKKKNKKNWSSRGPKYKIWKIPPGNSTLHKHCRCEVCCCIWDLCTLSSTYFWYEVVPFSWWNFKLQCSFWLQGNADTAQSEGGGWGRWFWLLVCSNSENSETAGDWSNWRELKTMKFSLEIINPRQFMNIYLFIG